MVGRGHPDKMCDAVGDYIVTAALQQDQESRVAIETTGGKGILFITGEITTQAKLDIKKIARKALEDCGYPNHDKIKIKVNLGKQSQDIAAGISKDNDEYGAGDQGIMYGYATDETPNRMPLEHFWATTIALYLDYTLVVMNKGYGSDFKTQVTTIGKKVRKVLVSIQHEDHIPLEQVRDEITRKVKECLEVNGVDYQVEITVNPAGKFNSGWFDADAGTTGRKIVVDQYGSRARVGGGAFSGKDYTKVDRSAAYMCRYVATNLVAHGIAKQVEIQVAYAIGQADPVSLAIECYGTNQVPMAEVYRIVRKNFSFKVADIIKQLNLKNTDYRLFSSYGHFGHYYAAWEQIKETLERDVK